MRFILRQFLFIALSVLLVPLHSKALESIKVGSTTRTMIVYAPTDIPQNRPLIINLHGMNQDAAYQQSQSKWETIADTAKFVVVFPNGISNAWDISGTSDVNFITTVIDTMYNRYGIDRKRVYLSGFSMGGMMTFHAANYIADKIAAFAPVSGYMLYGSDFTSARPIPIIQIQGEADDVVVYNDNLKNYLKGWIARNNCPATPVITKPYPSTKTNSIATKYYYGPGDDGVEVILITQAGKGHWWSMDVSSGINTSAEIWNFCRRFSLDPDKPTLTINSPANNSEFSPYDTIAFSVTATDADGTIANVKFMNGDAVLYTDSVAPYNFNWVDVALGTYKIKIVATDNEGKTDDASVTIKVNRPKPPVLNTVQPEMNSFNLPLTTDTFVFVYNKVVDCSAVKATMAGTQNSFDLVLKETGFSKTLTFSLPESAVLSDGDYSITISSVIGEHDAAAASDDVVKYSFGVLDASATIDTIFTDGWSAENIIPMGWKVTYNSNVREQGESYSLGPRILKFLSGGDFEYGMYLRDEGDVSRFSYGTYENSRLLLTPGMYTLSFYYSWWTAGAASSDRKINLTVLDTLGNVVYEQRDIATQHGFAENRNVVVSGSQLCELDFTVSKEQPYILQWSTEQFGYDGAIIGCIKMISIPSVSALAAKYKAELDAALVAASNAKNFAEASVYDGSAKTTLLNALTMYSVVSFTAPSEYQEAIDALNAASDAMVAHKMYVDYLSALALAKVQVANYKSSAYTKEAPYLKLVEKVNTYKIVDSLDVATMQTACDSLVFYTELLPNWVNNAIPALTYRLGKAVNLNELLGGNTKFLTTAAKTYSDDDALISELNIWNTVKLHNALSENTLVFDSLDMTGYIKNPNFYTKQTAEGIYGSTFPGWSVSAANSVAVPGVDEFATITNPVVDTDAKTGNQSTGNFEQTITGLPVGIYNVYMNTCVTADVPVDGKCVFYAVVEGADTLKTDFKKGTENDRMLTGLSDIEVTGGILTIGVRTGTFVADTELSFRWGDPSLWLVNRVDGYDYPCTGVKQIATNAEVKDKQYFTLQGQRLNGPTKGVNIIRITYKDGSVGVQKLIIE